MSKINQEQSKTFVQMYTALGRGCIAIFATTTVLINTCEVYMTTIFLNFHNSMHTLTRVTGQLECHSTQFVGVMRRPMSREVRLTRFSVLLCPLHQLADKHFFLITKLRSPITLIFGPRTKWVPEHISRSQKHNCY